VHPTCVLGPEVTGSTSSAASRRVIEGPFRGGRKAGARY
jgi:hypothetical protein